MTAKLWTASHSAPNAPWTDYDHGYLVYDPDGNPTSGDELVFRGGSSGTGSIAIEDWIPIGDSADNLNGDDPFTDRNYTEIASGTDATDKKGEIADWAGTLGTPNGSGVIVTDVPYTLPLHLGNPTAPPIPALNSNTVFNSALNHIGLDAAANMPRIGGDPLNARMSPGTFAGLENHISGGNVTVPFDNSQDRIAISEGGDSTYEIDLNSFGTGQIHIVEDTDAGTTDKIVLKNVDVGDVTFQRTPSGDLNIYLPWDAPGHPTIVVHNQWDQYGVPRMNTVWVEPTVGSPSVLPLNNPYDFPLDAPASLSDWVPSFTTPFGTAESYNVSPLVLDLGTGGIDLTSKSGAGAVYWDLDQDGFRELSGWVTGNTALLAIDKNSDGIINDNGELFGNTATYANGFTNLAQYDSNTNGHITSADTHYGDLLVWTDDNHDGYSQAGELHSLASLSITDISLTYSSSSATLNGNAIKQTGTFTMGGVSHVIDDVWFGYDPMNSRYDDDYTLDARALFLPDHRGYGDLPDLHIAMSQDSTLLDLVQDLAVLSTEDVLASASDLKNDLTDILYRWAGVDGVSPTSRGAYANAQQLGFMEALVGHGFYGSYTLNPGSLAVTYLNQAWEQALGHLGGTLLMQSGLADIFANTVYNPLTDTFSAGTFEDGITLRFNTPAQNTTIYGNGNNEVYLFHAGDSVSPSWDTVIETTTGGTDTILFAGIDPDDVGLWNDGSNNLYIKYSSTDLVRLNGSGSSGVSTIASYVERIAFDDNTVWDLTQGLPLTDTNDAHSLTGSAQNDVLDGRGGGDAINGYGGNDTIIGGTGSDQLYGGTGDDVFVFQVGDSTTGSGDYVHESASSGTDTIHLSGVNPNDVLVWTDTYNQLFISFAAGEKISIDGSGAYYSVSTISNYLEHITFDDSTDWNLTQGLLLRDTNDGRTLLGSAQNDVIDGRGGSDTINGYGGNDVLLGGDAGDTLNGGDGDDTLEGQAGNDTLNGDGGTDTLSYSTATSAITVSLASGSAQNTGGAGTDTISGFENLTGSAYNDTLTGNSSANTIHGGAGTNSLTGGGGADIFAFDPGVAMNNIQDFSTAQSDKLDVSALLDLYDPLTHAITDFVQITQSGANSALFVDVDGTAATYGFNQVASLIGATGLTDEAALLAAGTLIAA